MQLTTTGANESWVQWKHFECLEKCDKSNSLLLPETTCPQVMHLACLTSICSRNLYWSNSDLNSDTLTSIPVVQVEDLPPDLLLTAFVE